MPIAVVAYLRAQDQHQALRDSGIMATTASGFLVLVPVVSGTAQNNIANPAIGIVVGEVVPALLRGYAAFLMFVCLIGLILLVINHFNTRQRDHAEAIPVLETTP